MKIIALIAFKNEEQFLKYLLPQLSEVCDIILGHDDNSIDKSREIFTGFGGVLIPQSRSLQWGNGGEYQVRNALLKAGRENGGTHFICLDADELFTSDILSDLPELISRLQPGSALSLKWISCWAGKNDETLVYEPNSIIYKDFIFADDIGLEFPVGLFHISRTPTNSNLHIISNVNGGVLHLQNLNYENFLAKQLWYQLSEVVFSNHPYYYLDHKYIAITKKPGDLLTLNPGWIGETPMPISNSKLSVHWKQAILKMLQEVPMDKIEYLELWRHPILARIFEETYGVLPRKKTLLISVFEKVKLRIFLSRAWLANRRVRNAK